MYVEYDDNQTDSKSQSVDAGQKFRNLMKTEPTNIALTGSDVIDNPLNCCLFGLPNHSSWQGDSGCEAGRTAAQR